MKININLLTLIVFLFVSCTKFLDTPQKSGEALITTIGDCQSVIDKGEGTYNNSPVDGNWGTDENTMTDAEYNSISADFDSVSHGLYIWANDARIAGTHDWLSVYNGVYNMNVALEFLSKIGKDNPVLVSGDDYKLAEGMSLFIRANFFFQLAENYSRTYTAARAGQDMGIPVRLTSDLNAKSNRGTVQQTYDQIVKDIQQAISFLPVTTTVPTRPTRAAAYGLLARVYLSMGQYNQALDAAGSALQLKNDLVDYNTINTAVDGPFYYFNPEVLYFSSSGAPEINRFYGNYIHVNPAIIGLYSDSNDLRKKIFFKETSAGSGVYYFTGSYTSSTGSYFTGLAVDEIYLIRAECYARAGNTSSAMTDLNTLLRTRWVTGTYMDRTATGADDALSQILAERRKELVMRGQRWGDLKRLNLDPRFAITLTKTINGITYSLPPDDLKYQLLLPQDVIQFGSLPQNPR